MRAGAAASATADRTHARRHLLGREGLDDVVVGTAVETPQPVLQQVARRQHEHRRDVAALAARAQPVEARAVGELPVEQVGVERLAPVGLDVAEPARPFDRVAVGAQKVAQAATEQLVVFDQEQAHRRANDIDGHGTTMPPGAASGVLQVRRVQSRQ